MQALTQTPKGQKAPVIMAPQVVGIMLRLLMACDDANERQYTLETLCFLIGQCASRPRSCPSYSRADLLQAAAS